MYIMLNRVCIHGINTIQNSTTGVNISSSKLRVNACDQGQERSARKTTIAVVNTLCDTLYYIITMSYETFIESHLDS